MNTLHNENIDIKKINFSNLVPVPMSVPYKKEEDELYSMQQDIMYLNKINKDLEQKQNYTTDQLIFFENDEKIKQIEQDLMEINEMMYSVGELVINQGEGINEATDNITVANDNIDVGIVELEVAKKYFNKKITITKVLKIGGGAVAGAVIGGCIGGIFGVIPGLVAGGVGTGTGALAGTVASFLKF